MGSDRQPALGASSLLTAQLVSPTRSPETVATCRKIPPFPGVLSNSGSSSSLANKPIAGRRDSMGEHVLLSVLHVEGLPPCGWTTITSTVSHGADRELEVMKTSL